MTNLANAHPLTGYAAAQNYSAVVITALQGFSASFLRAVEFSRQCEAEFNRKGEIAPETYKRLIAEV